MFTKQNLLENITIISCCGLLLCILISYVTSISPLTGIWFVLYSIFTFLCSAFFSFKTIQCLLHINKPVQYDIQRVFDTYPQVSFLSDMVPKSFKRRKLQKVIEEWKEYDTNELSVISTVLERKLVSSWYVHYISQEIGFPFACKQMLDQMIGKTFQICHNVEIKDVAVDLGTILVSHFREYKKALKRHEKNPTSDLESLYKKSHFTRIGTSENTCNKKHGSGEHYTNLIRVILKELVSWELWDTPQIELLARILAKKMDNFIENSLADPVWLNEKILSCLNKEPQTTVIVEEKIIENDTKEKVQETMEKKEVSNEPKIVMATTTTTTTTIESALSTVVTKSVAPILKRPISDELPSDRLNDSIDSVEDAVLGLEPVSLDKEPSPVLRQKRGRQGRNEVKIYDRVIEGSVRTWETDLDLQCISLGQDLLASLNGPITLSRLWEQEDPDGSPNPPLSKDDSDSLWFGEEEAIDIELESSSKEPSPVKKEHSPKPAELLKELQSTVNQAKNKIGDLQVDSRTLDVPPKQYSGDEAAGMMEGLLDFGIAGFKKGLRLTGLSDDSDKSPSQLKDKSSTSTPTEVKKSIDDTNTDIADVQKEENGLNAFPTLVKQHRVISQDSVPIPIKPLSEDFPSLLSDSPEPEYEEAADLSTSIAKLRHLLQRADISPPRDEVNNDKAVWWDFAEETRGRTQHHHSSKPIDTATLADEYDTNSERNTSPAETSNNMQRLDKFFHRTVTGVFNSIKTAVGGDAEDDEASLPTSPAQEWTYVCTDIEQSVGGAVARFVGSRRAHSHVDAALDSLQQIPSEAPTTAAAALPPDDFEEWCGIYGAGWCVCCELAAAVGLCPSHVSHRLLLLFADIAESVIDEWLEELTSWIKKQVFVIFEDMSRRMETDEEEKQVKKEDKRCDVEAVCEAIVAKIPALYIVGEDNLKSCIRFALTSLGHKELNKDVTFRALDIFTLHFKNAAKVRNPSFDVN